jgi:hypothetical protein
MKLSNNKMLSENELQGRIMEVCNTHGIHERDQSFFLKNLISEHRSELSPSEFNTVLWQHLAEFFDLSTEWFQGIRVEVTDLRICDSNLDHFLDHLQKCKYRGLRPLLIFIRGEANTYLDKDLDQESEDSLSPLFLQLDKISKSGIAAKTFEHWEGMRLSHLPLLCQKAGIPYKGVQFTQKHYEEIKRRMVIPAEVLSKAKGIWWPETGEFSISHLEEKIKKIKFSAILPRGIKAD